MLHKCIRSIHEEMTARQTLLDFPKFQVFHQLSLYYEHKRLSMKAREYNLVKELTT